MTDSSILGELIVGRVEPRIYAFTTNTIPNYLKVGDTYRSVEVRLEEWREHFPNLKREFDDSAKIGDVFFRDYSVHAYLEGTANRPRLAKETFPDAYYSNEFFKGALRVILRRQLMIYAMISKQKDSGISFIASRKGFRQV